MSRSPRAALLLLVAAAVLGLSVLLPGLSASAAAVPASSVGHTAAASYGATAVSSYGASVVAAPAAPEPTSPTTPAGPDAPADPATTGSTDGTVTVDLNGVNGKPSSSIAVILGITVLSVAPALLLMTTSFTKIIVVLSLTRNALGLQNTPPNQVLAGLALFLSLFVMAPVLGQVNELGVQPYLHGTKTVSVAFSDGVGPLQEFMLDHTRKDELALMSQAAHRDLPAERADVPLTTLVPAFVLSELKSAFIIGFVIFVPFLVIDIVISASLMAMGMMMLPPVVISLPFKLLLFVMVDGWGLIVTALISSYGGGG